MDTVPWTGLLTISDLAERTVCAPATLRSWESRYGFPRPVRLAGGHRRYAEQDVAAVARGAPAPRLRPGARGGGTPRHVRAASQSRSLYAELRRRHPERRRSC